MSDWDRWAEGVMPGNPDALYAAVVGADGSVWGKCGSIDFGGDINEMKNLVSLRDDNLPEDIHTHGVKFGGLNYMFTRKIDSEIPNIVFFVRKGNFEKKEDCYLLCTCKSLQSSVIAVIKGPADKNKQAIVGGVENIVKALQASGY